MTSVKLEADSVMDHPSAPAPSTSRPGKSSFKFKNWDEHLLIFLEAAGLDQSAQGFKLDMLVMSQDKEKRLLAALERFCSTASGKPTTHVGDTTDTPTADSLDEIKQRYLPPNVPTPSQNTKAISRFLADVRSRTDQSNRDEFVHRRPPRPDPGSGCGSGPGTGSARTDAVKLNRDVQMKYDIVKNEDGPLGKTVKSKPAQGVAASMSTEAVSRAAFSERFEAVEAHLALKYVPAPPADFMLRVKHIEDHIIRLEKEYPPWAALHFNQPRRGWPPPPRESIIVVPPHLTSSTRQSQPADTAPDEEPTRKGKARASARQESSLLRAALDKLEVQKALEGQM
ncbi:hypothetical protein FRC06_008512 [Ceratobasidium sp. 370]|nr:hypothetical protein FRC06_008512 [Ceratobasidium sp. 370]